MRLSFAGESVLAVMAHPDDAELLCAGALARARADGAKVGLCIMCRGEKGIASGGDHKALGEIRQKEAAIAAAVIGAQLLWFNAPDGELFDTYEERKKLIEIYRRFQPTLVITHSPEDYHPDHRTSAVLAEAASWFSASRGHLTESSALASPPALWCADTVNMFGFIPGFYVDVSDFIESKKQMLLCHASQLQRGGDGDFAPLMELMLRQSQARGDQASVPAAEAFRSHPAFKRLRAW